MLTRVSRISSICSKRQLWGQRLWSYTTRWTFWYFFKYFVWAFKKVHWISSLWTRLPTTDSRWTSAIWRRIMSIWTLQCQVDFKKNVFLTKKQLIERYRTSRDPKLWLGSGHLAVRRAQNSIFRVCVDNFDENWHMRQESWNSCKLYWISFPGRCSSVDSRCSQFPWCQKANPHLSLSLRSLVRSGPPTEKVFKRFDFQQQFLFRKDVHHIFFWCDLPVWCWALSNRNQNFGAWFGLFCRQVFY